MSDDRTFCYWLSASPPVLRHTGIEAGDLGQWLPEEKIYRLQMYHWHATADEIEAGHQRAKALRPQHLLHHLAQEREVCLELNIRGVPTTFTSHNALVDERIFMPMPNVAKRYDAVYNARMEAFKRHWLAAEVDNLLILGGMHSAGDSVEYFEQTRAALPRATFSHGDRLRKWMGPAEVAATLNQARVGLCLSACEGAMYAATEYLLCGLPIVSTVSLGGRDEWFDTRFVRIVPDEPKAVAAAVRELIALRLSPQWIRQQTIRRLVKHRRRLIDVVQTIFDGELAGRDFAREWNERFFHKMAEWLHGPEVMGAMSRHCAGAAGASLLRA
jgi:glycosyltransferase involved in cell wall biosynthesis